VTSSSLSPMNRRGSNDWLLSYELEIIHCHCYDSYPVSLIWYSYPVPIWHAYPVLRNTYHLGNFLGWCLQSFIPQPEVTSSSSHTVELVLRFVLFASTVASSSNCSGDLLLQFSTFQTRRNSLSVSYNSIDALPFSSCPLL
jgi:hypothetical protein